MNTDSEISPVHIKTSIRYIVLAFCAGIVATLVVQYIVASIPVNNSQVNDSSASKIKQALSPKKISIENETFVFGYPNFGKYNGFPVGAWMNLDKNLVPDLRGNVAVSAHIIHTQSYSQHALSAVQKLYSEKRGADTAFAAIENNYLGSADETDTVKVHETMQSLGITFPVVIDQNNSSVNFAGHFNISAYPTILVTDTFGNVRFMLNGDAHYERLSAAYEYLQNEKSKSPPSIESLLALHADEFIRLTDMPSGSSVQAKNMTQLLQTNFYVVYVAVYKPGVDSKKGIFLANDYKDSLAILGLTSTGTWVVGLPHDNNYCTMLKAANLTHVEEKQYELNMCE